MATFYKFKQEELPVAAELILEMLKRDIALFEDFSPNYNKEYINTVQTQINKVLELTSNDSITEELEAITSDLYKAMENLAPKLDRLTSYVKKAKKSVSVKYADFGIREAKVELRRKNAAGASKKLKVVEQNLANNLETLKAEGCREKLGNDIASLSKEIGEKYWKQEEILANREQMLIDNAAEFNTLWSMITDISKNGKVIFAKNERKAKEYTFIDILKTVRKPKPVEKKIKKVATPPVNKEQPATEVQPQVEEA